MRILITGAAGSVGSTVARGLKDRHVLRGLDVAPMPELQDAVVGDISDFDTVLNACAGCEAIIHLAGNASGETPWAEILKNNIVGTYNVFEAARQSGARRIAFASRSGMFSPYPKNIRRTVDLPPRPESYYSCSKVFAESLGYMYAARFDMGVVAVRIGNFKRDRLNPTHPHNLSPADVIRVFEQAITHPGVKYEVVFGVSDSNWPLYDLDHGRRAIGYEPRDRSHVPESEWGQ